MFRSLRYRVDNEQVVLVLTILLVLGVIALTSTVTFCVSGIFIIAMFILSAMLIHSHHQSLIREALPINELRAPELSYIVEECEKKLQPGEIDAFLVNAKQLNAYIFGITSPKALVIYAPMLKVMTEGELKFVIGHEMGHVALGHTWLNTILGGMAGIPAPFGAAVLLYAAFRWWNRLCEFSADRAGLLTCGDLNLAISALVKLVALEVRSQRDFQRALAMIDAQDDLASNRLAEAFQSHPMLIRRINELRAYAQTREYQHLQAGVNKNLGMSGASNRGPSRQTSQSEVEPAAEETPEIPPEERWPWLKPKD
ncbi:MAG: M48 family metallopeptidase [Chloroflexota bacterium]|nr:M48 family metallopeptidase [Chloroflexota bacterium]